MSIEEMIGKENIAKGKYWRLPWRLVSGCTPCSPGCTHCWALAMEKRFTSCNIVTTHPERLDLPLKRKKTTVWAIWNDLFHEDVPDEFILKAWEAMFNQERHIFLVLTKRIKRMNEWSRIHSIMPRGHIWPGVTVCNQEELWKLDELQDIPAAMHWVSFEPLLENLGWINLRHVELVVLGGESGPGARPMNPNWVRSVRNQCEVVGVPFFFKQWGEWVDPDQTHLDPHGFSITHKTKFQNGLYRVGKKAAGRLLDGKEWNEVPKI